MKYIRPEAVDDLVRRYRDRSDGLRKLLKDADLTKEEEVEVAAQLQEVGKFLLALYDLQDERMNVRGI